MSALQLALETIERIINAQLAWDANPQDDPATLLRIREIARVALEETNADRPNTR